MNVSLIKTSVIYASVGKDQFSTGTNYNFRMKSQLLVPLSSVDNFAENLVFREFLEYISFIGGPASKE